MQRSLAVSGTLAGAACAALTVVVLLPSERSVDAPSGGAAVAPSTSSPWTGVLPASTAPVAPSLPAEGTASVVAPVGLQVAVNEGQWIGSIAIPALDLGRNVFEGIQIPTLDQGPGHWPGTAMPGEAGNVVLAGHRTSKHADFADLDQLEPGDEVIFETPDGQFVYTVQSTEIVEPNALWIADQTAEPTATMFACHPPGSVSQRIVVHLALAA